MTETLLGHSLGAMPSFSVRRAYQEAKQSWPSVLWDYEDYQTHYNTGDRPDHPVDLYLAGAAGYRVGSAWTVIEMELGPKARHVLQFQPIADMTVEDVWGETMARMMDNDLEYPATTVGMTPAKIIRYRARTKLINYLITIARRLAIERERRRHIVEFAPIDSLDAPPDSSDPSPDEIVENAELLEKMQECLNAAYGRLSAEQKLLLTMVYREGMKQKEAGAMLGWSAFKTSRQLAKAIKSLRSGLDAIGEAECSQLLTAGWSAAWENCWNGAPLETVPPNGMSGVSS